MKKRNQWIALAMATAMIVTAAPVTSMPVVFAQEVTQTQATAEVTTQDEYKLVWSDDFNGTELNRDVWNVEEHEKGWVNNELQEYVDSKDNVYVQDGNLYLKPVKKETDVVDSNALNLIKNANFSADADSMEYWSETIANWGGEFVTDATKTIENGKIIYDIKNAGTDAWHVQLKQGNVALKAGKTYVAKFKVTSTADKIISTGVQSIEEKGYKTYGENFPELKAGVEQEVSVVFTMSEDDNEAVFFISLGKVKGEAVASKVTISDISLLELDNLLADNAFGENNGFEEEITTDKMNAGTEAGKPWNIQKLEKVSLEAGQEYIVSYTAKSTVPRTIVSGVQQTEDPWGQYKQSKVELSDKEQRFSYEFTMENSDEAAGLYFNLGKEAEDEDTPESTITISNVVIAKKPSATGVTKKVSYTSGRISTQNKKTFTYGKFECRAKVPAGQGFLPAFWLMSNDENIYGQWPRCGEIDCMEVMGQDPTKVYGTIHYGNPHSESQGTLVTDGNTASETFAKNFAEDFHTFTCEWEPGKITWFVDGIKFHEENDWYSTTEGQGTLTYPAPFDQPFYIILNLAVGGSWVGNPDENTSFNDNPFIVDYVKVYQKDSYDENVTRPVKDVNLRDPNKDGNYINNGTFAEAEDLTDENNWKFLTALGGAATAEIKENKICIKTTDEGTVDYSVQLIQADVPFEKGATYKVEFDAWSSETRTMGVDVKAPDHGYQSYMPHQTAELTTEKQHFSYEFKMKSASDANGRLEYNMGSTGSTADINITNVKITKIKDADPNEKEDKVVLADGNCIYNGAFQEGDKHLGEWAVDNKSEASVSVTGFADGRRLKVVAGENSKASDVTLTQTDLAFNEGGAYEVSFDAQAEKGTTKGVSIIVGGKKFTANVTDEKQNFKFKIKSTDTFTNKDVVLELGTPGMVYVDNVRMVEDSLIKNGSFNAGMSGYEFYADSSASASCVVDSLKEDNALDITVNKTGDADWKVQVKQNNVPLEKGKKYKLTFKAKSSLPRIIRVVMQGLENKGWPVYSSDPKIALTENYQTFTETFTMEKDTDSNAFLSICLGKIDDEINEQHRVVIDDISLEEVVEETQKPGDSGNGGTTTPSNPGTSTTPTTPSTPTESDKPAQGDKPAESEKPAEEGKENTVVTKVEVTEKNTTAEVIKSTDSKGNTTVEANLVTTTAPNKKGEVTVQISNETLKKLVAEAGTNKVTVSQKLVDDDGKTICKVKMNVADVKPGKTLSVVKYDSKTKSYTLVDVDPVKVSKDGSIKLTTDETGTLKLMNSTDTKKFVQKILDSVKVTKKSDTVKKGKTTKVSLSKSLNTKNIKKITYSSSKSSVAKVDTNGKVVAKKAGTATIKATVTLQNGKKKTVSMKVKVK